MTNHAAAMSRPALRDVSAAPGPAEPSSSEALRRRLRRLALDVHDGPMQSLVASAYSLTGLTDLLRSSGVSGDEAAAQLGSVVDELNRAEQSMRALITTLESEGKAQLDALDRIAVAELDHFHSICTARTELAVPSGIAPDSHSQEIAIRAVLREALTNVAKHAHAANVRVSLTADEYTVDLEVEDDGVGFDLGVVGADRIGLSSMRERVHLLGGHLKIESRPGGPTRIRASLRRWRPGTPFGQGSLHHRRMRRRRGVRPPAPSSGA
jgi:signal transduction histidine kinase